MSTSELKNKAHSLIDSINDSDTLLAIIALLNKKDESDWWNDLSSANKESIERGLRDVKAGRVKNDKDAREEIDGFIAENHA